MVLGYSAVYRVEYDTDEHEDETDIADIGHHVSASECDGEECDAHDSGNDEVCKYVSCKETPKLHKGGNEGNDASRDMIFVNYDFFA